MAVGVRTIAAFLGLSLDRLGFVVSAAVAGEGAVSFIGIDCCASFSGILILCSSGSLGGALVYC